MCFWNVYSYVDVENLNTFLILNLFNLTELKFYI